MFQEKYVFQLLYKRLPAELRSFLKLKGCPKEILRQTTSLEAYYI